MVTDADGERWGATFVTYQNLLSLRAKDGLTGESLAGKYQSIADLIATGGFSDAFRRLPNR
ncbi:MAG TPA: hypothetical protein VK464_05660 [Symbiobacteriaceae bacterium]|nr:hypothetical protein [Symbiobacteriaceae bacterium]